MNPVTIEIDANAALVLFELLARLEDQDTMEISDQAEIAALWLLHGALESQVVDPLRPGYEETLAEARRQLRQQWGDAAH